MYLDMNRAYQNISLKHLSQNHLRHLKSWDGWSVAYHFRVTVTLTLTSDLVFIIIMSGAYLLYYLS